MEGFYLAADEQTVWAEWYRALAELGVPPMRQLPRDLWHFDVRLDRVADLSSDSRLSAVGLPPLIPIRSQWEKFQAVGEALAEAGWPGILYPSAARSEGAGALCLFRRGERMTGVDPTGPPVRYDEPPVPPRGLRT